MTIAVNGPGDVTLGAEDEAAAVAEVKSLLRIATADEDPRARRRRGSPTQRAPARLQPGRHGRIAASSRIIR